MARVGLARGLISIKSTFGIFVLKEAPAVAGGGDYTVRVVSIWDETYWDASDAPLTIVNPSWVENAVPIEHWSLYR